MAYLRAASGSAVLPSGTESFQVGVRALSSALEAPLQQIVQNAGYEPESVLEKVRSENSDFGFNADGGAFEPLMEAGVLIPTKVVRLVVANASSVTTLLSNTGAVLVDA